MINVLGLKSIFIEIVNDVFPHRSHLDHDDEDDDVILNVVFTPEIIVRESLN